MADEFESTVKDSSNTLAFTSITDLENSGSLTKERADKYKSKYAQLQEYVLKTYDNEKTLLRRAKQLNQDLTSEKHNLERASIRRVEHIQVIQSLEAEKGQAERELADAEQRETMLQYALTEVEREEGELRRKKTENQRQNADLVEPQLQRVRDEIQDLKDDLSRGETTMDLESKRLNELQDKLNKMEESIVEMDEQKAKQEETMSSLVDEPNRIRKQTDVVHKAAENLTNEIKKFEDRISEFDAELAHQSRKRREVDDVGKDLGRKLEIHRANIEQRGVDLEAVEKRLRYEKEANNDATTRKLELEVRIKAEVSQVKRQTELLTIRTKEFEALKKKLKTQQQLNDSAKSSIAPLQFQMVDLKHQLDAYKNERKQQQTTLRDLKQEVDIFISNFLRQETMEKEQRDSLEHMVNECKHLESQLGQWNTEEQKMNKTIAVLSTQREIKSRECSRATAMERDTQEEVKIKELIILDLTKKVHEINAHLKEFSKLYDIVKNERNKYVNSIQSSSQALAETKEKIKILQNEVQILKNESSTKDTTLAQARMGHQLAQLARDASRLEANKAMALYKLKQEQVEQQIVEIDKLNSIINQAEREMLELKKKYEEAVEARNYTGIQLIDRNDELCILYERVNLQERTSRMGEVEIRKREDEIRMLDLEMREIQRQIEVTRKLIPQMPQNAEKILQLQQELAKERETVETLSKDLETPENQTRWRPLGGEDPDPEQLAARIQVLEERLNDTKEQLLEKELVLEEVTQLSEKLRKQAAEGRSETLELAKQVNEFQYRIKQSTRKMMATVSELSMYQATAMRLQQDKQERESELERAQWRIQQGLAPSEDAEIDFIRMERYKMQLMEDKQRRRMEEAELDQIVHTTAEPRPNAYIPDELGLPKPYGLFTPFRPSEVGSTMRHFRNPKERSIEI